MLPSSSLPPCTLHTANLLVLVMHLEHLFMSIHIDPYCLYHHFTVSAHCFTASPKCNLSRSFLIVVRMWAVRVRVGCMELIVTVVQGEPFLCTPGAVQIHPIWLIHGVGFLLETCFLHHPQELPAHGVGWMPLLDLQRWAL